MGILPKLKTGSNTQNYQIEFRIFHIMKINQFKQIFFFILFFLVNSSAFCQDYQLENFYPLVLKVSGLIDINAGFKQQNEAFDNLGGSQNKAANLAFANQAKLKLKIINNNDSEFNYGAAAELQANKYIGIGGEILALDKAYLFSQLPIGTIELGNNAAVNQTMKVGPANFSRAAGGVNGNYLQYINLPICRFNCDKFKLPSFILLPQLPVAHGGYAQSFYGQTSGNKRLNDNGFGNMADATKINYQTPRINGWQLGVSFAPQTGDIDKVLSYGLNYSSNFDNLDFAISATGEAGKANESAKTRNINNLQAYDLGLMMSYLGLFFGASYGNWGNSLQPKNGLNSCNGQNNLLAYGQNCADGKFSAAAYYSLGLGYQFGHFATSLTYLQSDFQNNFYDSLSTGVDYKITKNLKSYFEITKYKFSPNSMSINDNQIQNNQGYVVLIGSVFYF